MEMRRSGVIAAMACALVLVSAAGSMRVDAAPSVSVLVGDHYGTRIFPDDAFTVADPSMVTGRRVAFRLGVDYPTVGGVVLPACDSTNYSLCDGFAQLNRLDGFDLQPRVTVPLTGAVKLASVDDSNFYISDSGGAGVSGLRQLTFDPVSRTLAGIADKFLKESTTYAVHVTSGILDSSGAPIDACGGACTATFTTGAPSAELVNIRKSMDLPLTDPQNAFVQAGLATAASRKASFTQNGVDDVFLAASVKPSLAPPLDGLTRNDQTSADPAAPLTTGTAPNLILLPTSNSGYYAFGAFQSPRYQFASASGHQDNPYGTGDGYTDGEIPPVPTTQTPAPFGHDTLGIIVVTPNPTLFPKPWPVAIYGPGFTRSKFDIFVTADYNASVGIMTVATDPAGHSFGPKSTVTVNTLAGSQTFLTYGRGRDLNGDGKIADGLNDGVGPTAHVQGGVTTPSHKPIDGVRSGLVQTVIDNMALGRSLAAGLDIPGVGTDLVDKTRIMYYGLSFGGIYGTMLMGTDPLFHQGLLNVPGGPIVDIARLSGFRGNISDTLKVSRPDMLNGGPGANGFTEDLPLRNDPPQVIQHAGAFQLQDLFGATNWYDRSGSPETFAPRIRLRPDPAWATNPKIIAFQSAYGDATVPNPTAGVMYRAGDLFDRVVYYRNEKTPTFNTNPHGWLADPTLAGRTFGEAQLTTFLATGQLVTTNPVWLETPVADPNNFECLHYADPQTGVDASTTPRSPFSGDCPAAPSHGTLPNSSSGGSTSGGPSNTGGSTAGSTTGLTNTAGAAGGGGAAWVALATGLLMVAAARRRRLGRER
jgi:hypothetical protein